MNKIENEFCGYIEVDGNTFTYFVSNHMVTLLPAEGNPHKRNEMFEQFCTRDIETPEYYTGLTGNAYQIALFRNGNISKGMMGLDPSIRFWAPVIIRAVGNADGFYRQLTTEWSKFHAISFYSGNINALYSPRVALQPRSYDEITTLDKNRFSEIKFRPYDEYTHSTELKLNEEEVTFSLTITKFEGTDGDENKREYNVGKLNSLMRFSFKDPNDYKTIEVCYKAARGLIAILTKQNNVSFDSYLSQKSQDGQLFKTADCKIFNAYNNLAAKKEHQVIPIHSVWNYIPNLIEKILNDEAAILLTLLPDDNKELNRISITNIQDLCTALEVAYGWSEREKEKNPLIKLLKVDIKKTISEFCKKHSEIDVHKETTISSAFQYLDYTLKEKILALYAENQECVDPIISKRSLPQIDESSVGAFVKMRNGKTHSGMIDWDDNANLYTALFALMYSCFFTHIGMPKDEIKLALQQLF